MCIITMLSIIWAINSEGECLLDVEKVIGSNPILPTKFKKYQKFVDYLRLTQIYTNNLCEIS